MVLERKNTVGIEGEAVSFQTDALAEERQLAQENYRHFEREVALLQAQLPHPDVHPQDTAYDLDDVPDLQYKKSRNKPYWEKINAIRPYCIRDELYSGHVRYSAGGNRYFMESTGLASKEWVHNGHSVVLINVDDRRFKHELDSWRYPDKKSGVLFSRNIAMRNKQVQEVDVVLDRTGDPYAHITDNYLRNALKRNKDRKGIHSIIQTIQEKQNVIRDLEKSRSFIVQGCAGSGKTMVLLHRLRYLIYNEDIQNSSFFFLLSCAKRRFQEIYSGYLCEIQHQQLQYFLLPKILSVYAGQDDAGKQCRGE